MTAVKVSMETESQNSTVSYGSVDLTANTSSGLLLGVRNSSDELHAAGASDDWWKKKVQVRPDWPQLRQDLGWSWQLHTYGLACTFLVLACAAFFTILGIRAQLSTRPHLTTVNVFLCLLGTSRTLSLFVDPYGSRELMPGVITAVLWDLAFPCLLSSFSLLQLAFLQTARMKVAPSRLVSDTGVTLIVSLHFILTIAADILWTINTILRVVWLVVQVAFVIWGLCLCLTFICGCVRVLRSVAKLPPVFQVTTTDYKNKGLLNLGILSRHSPSSSNGGLLSSGRGPFAPKIRITDDKEQTFSYASDTSHRHRLDSFLSEGSVPTTPARRCPLATPDTMSDLEDSVTPSSPPSHHQCRKKSSRHSHYRSPSPSTQRFRAEYSSQCQPLMETTEKNTGDEICAVPEKVEPVSKRHQSTSSSFNTGSLLGYRSYSMKSHVDLAEFRFDLEDSGSTRRTLLENVLRRLAVSAVLGVIVCILHVYGVFGPHGLMSGQSTAAIVPWFCYQTVYRIAEFSMGCTMAAISRYSLHSHCHYSCPVMELGHPDT